MNYAGSNELHNWMDEGIVFTHSLEDEMEVTDEKPSDFEVIEYVGHGDFTEDGMVGDRFVAYYNADDNSCRMFIGKLNNGTF